MDAQDVPPEIPLKIDRVGVKEVSRRILIASPEGPLSYDVVLDAYIDLPHNMRGIHMSRNIEAFIEAIEEARKGEAASLEEFLEVISHKLLEKHGYATRAEVRLQTKYYYMEDFINPPVPEAADVAITVLMDRSGRSRRSVAVSLIGVTACPSAQITFSEREGIPPEKSPTHLQRARLTICVKTTGKRIARIEWLVEAARDSFSAPVVSFLKKPDEHRLLKKALRRPRFVEDVVRYALDKTFKTLVKMGFPEETLIRVEVESLESIHPHNAYASREATIGELREETSLQNF